MKTKVKCAAGGKRCGTLPQPAGDFRPACQVSLRLFWVRERSYSIHSATTLWIKSSAG